MILTKAKIPALKATGEDYNLTIDNSGIVKSEAKPTISALDYKFKISDGDTTPDFAISKIIAGDGIDILKEGALADESLRIYNTKKNLSGHLSLANHPFLNIQTVPPGEAPITTFVKIGDPSDTGTTAVKNILLTGMEYFVDIKIIIETPTEGFMFELKLNGDETYWDTDLTIETIGNLEFQTSMGVPEPTDIKYIGIAGVQRIYISDVPKTFSTIRISGRINTGLAGNAELSVSMRNIDTISPTDFSHIEVRKGTIIHSTLCNF